VCVCVFVRVCVCACVCVMCVYRSVSQTCVAGVTVCVAERYSVLHCVLQCDVLTLQYRTDMCCRRYSVCCRVLQCVAACVAVQCFDTSIAQTSVAGVTVCVAGCCGVLQQRGLQSDVLTPVLHRPLVQVLWCVLQCGAE